MTNALDAVVEIFTWVGLGVGGLFAVLTLVAYLVDGTWMPVRGYVEPDDDGRGGGMLRWFDEDGEVNVAHISAEEWRDLGGAEAVEVFARRGTPHRMRRARRAPAVRLFATLAAVLLGVGVIALLLSVVLLFSRG
jgi:hypothetical protein